MSIEDQLYRATADVKSGACTWAQYLARVQAARARVEALQRAILVDLKVPHIIDVYGEITHVCLRGTWRGLKKVETVTFPTKKP